MPEEKNPSIASQTVRGSVYSVLASGITIGMGILRAYLMVRYLLPGEVGVAAQAMIFVHFASQLSGLGLTNAFLHRQTDDESVRRTYLTLSTGLRALTLLPLVLLAPWLASFYPEYDAIVPVIWVYSGVSLLQVFNLTQNSMLTKNLEFRKQALMDVIGSLAMTIIGPVMAFSGYGVWAIVGERVTGLLSRMVMVLFVYRTWTPRFGWDRGAAGWFWDYGKKVWISANLTYVLDRFDDFWTGLVLGVNSLGLYSKAYEFSRYPRRVIANPILSVFLPTFASLQTEPLRLSRAFFRATSLMVRVGGLFSLLFILTAPEVFDLALPAVWLPMLGTFQLMIVYTFLDPLAMSAQDLLHATGHPGGVARTRGVQVVVFLPAVILLSRIWGIEGVAIAADLMVLIGAVLLFRQTKGIVSYDSWKLWLWPVVALLATVGVVIGLDFARPGVSVWGMLLIKLVLIPLSYLGVLWFGERDQLLTGGRMIWGLIRPMLRPLRGG